MEDESEAYLRLANKLRWKHFPKGHSSLPRNQHKDVHEVTLGKLLPMPSAAPRLPMKKRKRTNDSDDDTEIDSARVVGCGKTESDICSTAPLSPSNKTRTQGRMTLMEKWFPGSTLRNATLDAAQAPSLDYTEMSVARISAARERLLSLRSVVEDVMRCVHLDGDTKSTNNNDNDCSDILDNSAGWSWLELRDALSQISLRDSFQRKKRVEAAVKWLLSRRLAPDVPRVPVLREWDSYLDRNGPEQGCEPPLTLLVWLDGACTTTLFTALVNRMLKAYKSGMKVVEHGDNKNEKNCDQPSEADEEGGEDEEYQKRNLWTADHGEVISLSARLSPLHGCGESEDIISLLSFLRVLMPVDFLDGNGNIIGHSVGYGVWLYASLTALDIPLDPDTDRLAHNLFTTCCCQIRTLGEKHRICGDNRGDIVQFFPPRNSDVTSPREYNVMSDVKCEDVLALHTIIIVLSKLFRQNQNRLIPF